MQNIVDEVIRSKHQKRCNCCICLKKNTKPYVIPEREIIKSVYDATSSFEIFKIVKAFWFCDEHLDLFKSYYENNCDSKEMDMIIENSYDEQLLGRLNQMFADVSDTVNCVRNYINS